MKRFALLAVLVAALSIGLAGTASAFVSSLNADAKADLSASKTEAVVTGTIVCTAGDVVNVGAAIVQSSGKVDALAAGSTTITCTGGVQTFAVTTTVVLGSALKHGPAVVIVGAFDTTDSTFQELTQGIKLG